MGKSAQIFIIENYNRKKKKKKNTTHQLKVIFFDRK